MDGQHCIVCKRAYTWKLALLNTSRGLGFHTGICSLRLRYELSPKSVLRLRWDQLQPGIGQLFQLVIGKFEVRPFVVSIVSAAWWSYNMHKVASGKCICWAEDCTMWHSLRVTTAKWWCVRELMHKIAYHANMWINMEYSLVSTRFIQFWCNKLFYSKHHSILSSKSDDCSWVFYRLRCIFHLKYPAIGRELWSREIILQMWSKQMN